MTKRAALYLRVSTDGQTTANQQAELEAVAKRSGWQVVEIYRDHPVLRDIRDAKFHGPCGSCTFAQLCGGSRARAYAMTGDALASDPGCWLVAHERQRHE